MRELRTTSRQDSRPVDARFRETIQKSAGFDITDDLNHYIEQGELIPTSVDMLGPCFVEELIESGPYDRGYDMEAANRGAVEGVQSGSEAHRAGLRNGQKMLKRKLGGEGVSQILTVTIADESGERTLRYRPIGQPRVMVPQFHPREDTAPGDLANCAKPFGLDRFNLKALF